MTYKKSEEHEKRLKINKKNAKKNIYHHVMGTGGYKAARPKWEKTENDLIDKGINPEPVVENWAERAKSWFYGHGGKLDPATGKCIYTSKHLATPLEGLRTAIKEVQEGKFHPDRENDELTRALGNKEKPGRTRGTDGSVPWKYGFPDDRKKYPEIGRASWRERVCR